MKKEQLIEYLSLELDYLLDYSLNVEQNIADFYDKNKNLTETQLKNLSKTYLLGNIGKQIKFRRCEKTRLILVFL